MFKNKNFIFFLISFVTLTSILVLFYINSQKIKSSSDLVEHTREVLQKSDEIFLDVLTIETSTRGYLLTGNEEFLDPYSESVVLLNLHLKQLATLTNDNNNQKLRIESLSQTVLERIDLTKNSIKSKKENSLKETEKLIILGKARILTDKIRSLIADINTEEFRLLKIRKSNNELSKTFSNWMFIALIFLALGTLVLVFIVLRNQKIKERIEVELKKSNELFSSLFNYNPASISISSFEDNRLIKVNESFLQSLGFQSAEEVIGKTLAELKIINDDKLEDDVLRQLQKNKIVNDIELKKKTKQGEEKWFSNSILLIEIDNKECLFSVSIDITNRKRTEEQLLILNNELEAFSYSVSHDLRAPLRAINGYAKIIQEDYSLKLDTEANGSIKAILKNSKRMGELIDDLLAFSRLGKKELSLTEINMNAIVKSVQEEEIQGNTREIEFNLHHLLPTMGQQALIKQVWTNLISNAIKYSTHNDKILIEIGSYDKDQMTVYYVKDNGAGFDMRYYDKLFGVFQRLHSQDDFEGTGIGLAIVKKIINNHKGQVWAESELHKGASFFFSLPFTNTKLKSV